MQTPPSSKAPAIILAAALATLITACARSIGYSDYAEIPPPGWAYGDTLTFIPDSAVTAYPCIIGLRHTGSYPWTDIVLEVSDSRHRDTINVSLCDTYGKWRGTGFGDSYQVATPMPFAPTPSEPLHFRHVMRVDTLRGLTAIGLLTP